MWPPCMVSSFSSDFHPFFLPLVLLDSWVIFDEVWVRRLRRSWQNLQLVPLEVVHCGFWGIYDHPVEEAILFLSSAFLQMVWCLLSEFAGISLNSFSFFFLMTLLWRLYLCRCRCTVEQFTTTPESAKSSWRSFAVKQGFWFALSSSPMSSSLWKFSWSSRPQLDLHRSCWLQFLNYITNWGNGYLKTLCDLIACFVDMNYFQSATLYLEDPTAEDCWVKGWGVRVFIKLWHLHHLAFPNDDCEQAIALTSELMSEALVKVIWALKSLGVSKLLHGAPFLFFY